MSLSGFLCHRKVRAGLGLKKKNKRRLETNNHTKKTVGKKIK
jgi:hypothetical protein